MTLTLEAREALTREVQSMPTGTVVTITTSTLGFDENEQLQSFTFETTGALRRSREGYVHVGDTLLMSPKIGDLVVAQVLDVRRHVGQIRGMSLPMIIRRGEWVEIPLNAADPLDDGRLVRVHVSDAPGLAGTLREVTA